MLNHTYTSVKNANLVDCGKKQHIPSQPSALIRDNFLGEYRTELDKKKVLANLGIATDLSLEWEYIKGDIGKSKALMDEFDARTKYVSEIDGFQKTIIEGIKYLETVVGGEQEGEEEQNNRLTDLENTTDNLIVDLEELKEYLETTIEVDIDKLEEDLTAITEKVNNITNLIQVSSKEGNALTLLSSEDVSEGETPGLYVPDLSESVTKATEDIEQLRTNVGSIQESLETFVTKEDLGGGDFDFVNQDEFDSYKNITSGEITNIKNDLKNTVKTGEDGHVDTLYVNKISKNNDENNIIITDSFEAEEGIPLDVRFVRETLEELYALPVKVCYPGMGVVVNSLSALYILRKPKQGISLTQEYISDPNNWKCPEDLVTVALTREQYENLEEINPNVFYYIYEEEITRTKEPLREEYLTEEEYQIELQKWIESLKVLSQEYMSASWGVDIENKLGKKASSQSVSVLMAEINNIKGNGNNPSLESLNKSVISLQEKDSIFKETLDEILIRHDDVEVGRLVEVEKEVTDIKENLENYVTKEYIQDSSNEFIFVKNEQYQQDQTELQKQLSKKIETEEVVTNNLSLSGNSIEFVDERLKINEIPLANLDDVPELEVLTQSEYDEKDKKGELDDSIYYYTYDEDIHTVTSEELAKSVSRLQQQINVLFRGGTVEDIEGTLDTIFLPIETWNTFQKDYQQLAELVHSLEQRILQIETSSIMHTGSTIYVSGNPDRSYYEGDTVYIESETITFE